MPSASVVRRPDRTRVSGAVRGIRTGRPRTDERVGGPDRAVLGLVGDPFEDIGDAHARLTALESVFREREDRRGAFLVVYARVTEAVGEAIEDGVFADPEWATEYLVAFADLYREALFAYETGDLESLADPWQIAFDAASGGTSLVAQDVVLGINAHVNYDLALALATVGIDPNRRQKYADHCTVNRILRRLVDEVQDSVAEAYAPGIATVDESLGRLDEVVGYETLREGRDSAWRSAVALHSRFWFRRGFTRWLLRVSSTGLAYLVLAPTHSERARETLRALEQQPPDAPSPRREE